MIKFFRSIRQGLINKGNFKRYLLYAIGEILLVMIGILLAFQVNKWKEQSNNRDTELQYYSNIKRQLNEDLSIISGNSDYNQHFLNEYQKAIKIIERNDRSQMDSLCRISRELVRYSDAHLRDNIYETLVQSGQTKLLSNDDILEGIQKLEETFIYVNRLENTHFEVIMRYFVPIITETINVKSGKVEIPDNLYDYKFLNNFALISELMQEKEGVYNRAREEINGIIKHIDDEIN